MLDWLTSKGFRVTIRQDGSVFLQRGAGAWEYPSIKSAFLGQDGPYTSCKVSTGAWK